MKRWLMIVVLITFMGLSSNTVHAGSGPAGPAPNSGDGIPDGSGHDPSPPSPGPLKK